MCGIAGVISLRGRPLATSRLKPMVDALAHRGPDDAGYFVWNSGRSEPRGEGFGCAFTDREFKQQFPLLPALDAPEGRERLASANWDLFLGHRRLAILDLSPRGHQPMSDRSGRRWLAYNGEVYNFRELRSQLEKRGYHFQSATDTEVILYAYEEWGIECVERLNGMFAFALWDDTRRSLFLARDRFGIKPLYLCAAPDQLAFASEVKALLAWRNERQKLDLLALNEYFSFQNILSDRTLFADVRMLPPGTVMEIDVENGRSERRGYWDLEFREDTALSREAAEAGFAEHLEAAVRRQCVSDVPVGSYLSGGMDSGSVSCFAARQLGRIFTFTVGFDLSEAAEHELHFDERARAELLANTFQTEHYECVLHSGDMEACLDELVWALEDLRLGQSYPNYYVARLASKFVKVVLTGAGGDELFAGYPWRYAAALAPSAADYVENYYRYWQRLVSNTQKQKLYNAETRARLGELRDGDAVPFVNHTLSVFKRTLGNHREAGSPAAQVRNALYFECKTFLHGLLVVEDKLSMAHSLEARVPLLDNELVDFALRIPIELNLEGIERLAPIDENLLRRKRVYGSRAPLGKRVPRSAMSKILPREFLEAPKQGFSAPDESWFRGRSEAYLRDVLLAGDSPLYRFLSRDFVAAVLAEHVSGRVNRRLLIWSLLCFAVWLERFEVEE